MHDLRVGLKPQNKPRTGPAHKVVVDRVDGALTDGGDRRPAWTRADHIGRRAKTVVSEHDDLGGPRDDLLSREGRKLRRGIGGDVSVALRTGDTPQRERQAMLRKPPDVLITTPESLYLMLTSRARELFEGVHQRLGDEPSPEFAESS